MEPIRVVHSSDVLCVWAYVGQIRMDRLAKEFPREVAVEYRYVSVFGSGREKLEERWRLKGGLAAYAEHVRDVVAKFEHVRLSPDTWALVAPASSMPAHLLLCAVRLLEREGLAAAGAQAAAAWRVREAFFRDARDVSDQEVLQAIAGEAELDRSALDALLRSGRAHAELARDLDAAREQDVRVSPTLVLNDGRQRLSGNVGYRAIAANVREILEKPVEEASWC
jgi:predicted DsbA family dithiol-disulfide isomerase